MTRLGRIFVPDGSIDWMRSHASNPFIRSQAGSQAKVLFSPRDRNNRSHIAGLTLTYDDGYLAVSKVEESPLLEPGPPDSFDKDGVTMGCTVQIDDEEYLYYVGWSLEPDVPFRTQIGIARWNSSRDRFERLQDSPIIKRDEMDLHSFSYPWVVRGTDGLLWMYYGTATEWKDSTETQHHVIRLAKSSDGISWIKVEEPVLNPISPEIAVVRPAVYQDKAGYRMWFCSREANGPYRIFCAQSSDGVTWLRNETQLFVQSDEDEFDSEMQCYAVELNYANERHLLYNGNGYGRTGFGVVLL